LQQILKHLKSVANRDKFNISKDAYVEGEVGIGPIPTGFSIEVTLNVYLSMLNNQLRIVALDLLQHHLRHPFL
jgi:organic hydroperoxide reductase OsmC/OhrA